MTRQLAVAGELLLVTCGQVGPKALAIKANEGSRHSRTLTRQLGLMLARFSPQERQGV